MSVFRKSAVSAACSILLLSLFTVLLGFSLLQLLRTPDALKQSLASSKVYDNLVVEALKQAQSGTEASLTIPTDQPEVEAVIADAFPPAYIRAQTEKMIDGIYTWMKGDTATIAFTIELGPARTRLLDGITGYADRRLAALPVCTDPSAANPNDPFRTSCVPPGFDRAAAVEQVRRQLTEKDSFLERSTITAADLRSENGQTLEGQLAAIQTGYGRLQQITIGATLLSAAMGVIIVYASATRRSGLKLLCWFTIVICSMSLFTAWMVGIAVGRLSTKAAEQGRAIDVPIARFLDSLIGTLQAWWIGLSLGLMIIGAGILIGLLVVRKRREHHDIVHGPVSFSAKLSHEDAGAGAGRRTKPSGPKQHKK